MNACACMQDPPHKDDLAPVLETINERRPIERPALDLSVDRPVGNITIPGH